MAEILHQLICSSSHYLQGFIHPRWCRISSINSSTNMWNHYRLVNHVWTFCEKKRTSDSSAPLSNVTWIHDLEHIKTLACIWIETSTRHLYDSEWRSLQGSTSIWCWQNFKGMLWQILHALFFLWGLHNCHWWSRQPCPSRHHDTRRGEGTCLSKGRHVGRRLWLWSNLPWRLRRSSNGTDARDSWACHHCPGSTWHFWTPRWRWNQWCSSVITSWTPNWWNGGGGLCLRSAHFPAHKLKKNTKTHIWHLKAWNCRTCATWKSTRTEKNVAHLSNFDFGGPGGLTNSLCLKISKEVSVRRWHFVYIL